MKLFRKAIWKKKTFRIFQFGNWCSDLFSIILEFSNYDNQWFQPETACSQRGRHAIPPVHGFLFFQSDKCQKNWNIDDKWNWNEFGYWGNQQRYVFLSQKFRDKWIWKFRIATKKKRTKNSNLFFSKIFLKKWPKIENFLICEIQRENLIFEFLK